MTCFWQQLKFDGRRLILRNGSFQFFSIMMPASFYLLFTRVMVTGNAADMAIFRSQYMCSMLVYSGTINALFGIAQLLMHDRERGLLRWLTLTPGGVRPYYLSVGCLSLVMNLLAVGVLGTIAVLVNQVSLSVAQWLAIAGLMIIGQLPVLLMGVLLSFINRAETLSLASNLITFPLAIISGLWWPIRTLPTWLQPVGKQMPTYFLNDLLGRVVTRGTLETTNVWGLLAWIVGLLILVVGITRHRLNRGGDVVTS